MTPAFWDSSALVPLCLQQPQSAAVQLLSAQYSIAVWWAAPVELRSAFERLLRMGQVTTAEHGLAGALLATLRRKWRQVEPSDAVRAQAEVFLMRHSLRAADALQLAAAWAWCSGSTQGQVFVCADAQLLAAARQVGFQVVAV